MGVTGSAGWSDLDNGGAGDMAGKGKMVGESAKSRARVLSFFFF